MSMHSYPVYDDSGSYLVFTDDDEIQRICDRYEKVFEDEGTCLEDYSCIVFQSYASGADSIRVRYRYRGSGCFVPVDCILAVPIAIIDNNWCQALFGTRHPYWKDVIGAIGDFELVICE